MEVLNVSQKAIGVLAARVELGIRLEKAIKDGNYREVIKIRQAVLSRMQLRFPETILTEERDPEDLKRFAECINSSNKFAVQVLDVKN